MKIFALALPLLLAGCVSAPQWCADNPRLCDVAETAMVVCVAVGAGLLTQQLHKSAINPTPKEAPFVTAFYAADQSRKWIDTFRKEVPPK